MVLSFCRHSYPCTMAWWWPTLEFKTGCQIIHFRQRVSCVWLKILLHIEVPQWNNFLPKAHFFYWPRNSLHLKDPEGSLQRIQNFQIQKNFFIFYDLLVRKMGVVRSPPHQHTPPHREDGGPHLVGYPTHHIHYMSVLCNSWLAKIICTPRKSSNTFNLCSPSPVRRECNFLWVCELLSLIHIWSKRLKF
jgi:hypothetical protein